jgi:putative membrane protein
MTDMYRIYCGVPPEPADILSRWNFDPVLLLVLGAFAAGTWMVRPELWRRLPVPVALAMLLIAFVSPLCALSSALFSARVVHHLLLVLVVAPLLAVAFVPARKNALALPLVVSSVVLWIWHAPAAYNLALSHVGVYWLMQCTLFGSFLWFWRAVEAPQRAGIEAVTAVIASFAQMGLLGAILTFAPGPLYAVHSVAPLAWGLAPLTDQQLGGLIMWVPAGVPYAVLLWRVWRNAWHGMLAQA